MTIDRETTVSRVQHLTVFGLSSRPLSPNVAPVPVVIVGNAYGVLPYIPRLAEELSCRGFDAFWFPTSGQDGTPGICSLRAAAYDLELILDHVRRTADRSPLVVAHCAGTMAVTELFALRGDLDIPACVFYGMLLQPARRRAKAIERLDACGVRHQLEERLWNYPWEESLHAVTAPVLVCHARDALNLDRGTEPEVNAAVKAMPHAKLRWFDHGYDVRFEAMPAYADLYESWLRHHSMLETTLSLPTSAVRSAP